MVEQPLNGTEFEVLELGELHGEKIYHVGDVSLAFPVILYVLLRDLRSEGYVLDLESGRNHQFE